MKMFIGRTVRLKPRMETGRRTTDGGRRRADDGAVLCPLSSVLRFAALVLMALLAWGLGVATGQERSKGASPSPDQATARAADADDPNESWWRRWDAGVKDPNSPEELLSVKWQAIVRVLQSKDLEQKVKERIIDRIVSPTFDFPVMGQLALGRTHWPKLNEAQREKFTRLFVARLKPLYLEKTALYKGQKIALKPGTVKKSTAQVPMTLTADDGDTAILYRLHKLDEKKLGKSDEAGKIKAVGLWRIYDVEIEGVSILLTYRSQFDDILRRGSVDDLLAQLEKPPTK